MKRTLFTFAICH